MTLFKGSGVAIVTPMNTDESINYEKLGELIDYQIAHHTDAIIICGTTGEAPALDDDEHKEAIKYTVERVNKRVPVIAGTGSNNTSHAIMMSQYAESVGADGVLLVSPYYNKSTQRGLVKHFTAIANSISIDCILYNVPGRTGINIAPATVAELAKVKNITAVKEASGDIAQCVEIARLVPDDFYIYSGNDDMITPLLSIGGHGVISVLANVAPEETHDLVMSYLDGDVNKSKELQLQVKSLVDALFCEVNPIPVKTALNLMGYEVGNLRLPLYEMADENKARLEKELKAFGLLK
ncbi:MAG: 4-hydroxy-tetrahydrodipicolinate synthase [Clostridia bacterium]|nr:4-hydroxy-tetrahydrodipicolinate synthase [Clostridia bacterium]